METTPIAAQKEFCPWTDRLPEEAFQKRSPEFLTPHNTTSDPLGRKYCAPLKPEKRAYLQKLYDEAVKKLDDLERQQQQSE